MQEIKLERGWKEHIHPFQGFPELEAQKIEDFPEIMEVLQFTPHDMCDSMGNPIA